MKRLTLERQMLGMSIKELAAKAHVAYSIVAHMESGYRDNFWDATKDAVAHAVGWSGDPEELLEDIKRGDVV